jgi:SNF2 family DNA or RNA helicase
MSYTAYLEDKSQRHNDAGFDPVFMPDYLFDFQQALVAWSLRKGRAALFEDCGLGKTIQQLVFAENVARKTGKRVLLLTPLAVGLQTCQEAEKFGIYAQRSRDGKLPDSQIVVTNYEKLHLFDSSDFVGCVCDESSILKNVDGVTKTNVTQFMRHMDYRLLCTATAAPNDYIELGTSSEALGNLGYTDMLKMFFKKQEDGRLRLMQLLLFRVTAHPRQPLSAQLERPTHRGKSPSEYTRVLRLSRSNR